MTDKAQPFTEEEREKAVEYAKENTGSYYRFEEGWQCQDVLRWAATLAQVEAERDAALEELEALQYEFVDYCDRTQ